MLWTQHWQSGGWMKEPQKEGWHLPVLGLQPCWILATWDWPCTASTLAALATYPARGQALCRGKAQGAAGGSRRSLLEGQ